MAVGKLPVRSCLIDRRGHRLRRERACRL
jgi:hypothetical protein